MTTKKNGGPAFPFTVFQNDGARCDAQGMTLRDYFAAKAMQAMMPLWAKKDVLWKKMAELSYEMADAMLEERTK